MDKATFLGLFVGLGAILLGQVLEGGHLSDMIQATAALIVFGGTAGAVMISTPMEHLRTGLQLVREAFLPTERDPDPIISDILLASQTVTTGSLIDLEKKLSQFAHPDLRNVLRLVIDGVDSKTLREIVEEQIGQNEKRWFAGAKIWSDAGGYAPTIGILGAVLGLIHVMSNLSDTSKLGAGIAVAFVATIYGVASANIVFLPIGNKLKAVIHEKIRLKEMILEGAVAISEGRSVYVLREKLQSYKSSSSTT